MCATRLERGRTHKPQRMRRVNGADPITLEDLYHSLEILNYDPVYTGEEVAKHPATVIRQDLDAVEAFHAKYFEGREELRLEMCASLIRILLCREKLASFSITGQAVLDRLIDEYGDDEVQWQLIAGERFDVLRIRVIGIDRTFEEAEENAHLTSLEIAEAGVAHEDSFYQKLLYVIMREVEFYPIGKRVPLGLLK